MLKALQPRQIEWLYYLSIGDDVYTASYKMGIAANRTITLRQNFIRGKLGLKKRANLKKVAMENKQWLKDNVKIQGLRNNPKPKPRKIQIIIGKEI